jgi:hypothetical protein
VALPAVAFASPATGTPSATSIPSAAQTPTAQASTSSIPVAASSAGNNEQQRAQSDGLLWASRRALAVGDTRRANEALAQAKSLQVQYKFHEDSPAKVEAAIARYTDLVQIKDKESDAYRRRYADLQMQQAEDLLRWRDFDEAERLTTEAKRRGVAYTPFENNPDALLKRIGEARKGSSVAAVEPLPAINNSPVPASAAKAAPTADVKADVVAKNKAQTLDLVKQARAALNSGDMAAAENLAHQAESLGVPDSAFSPQEDRAWLVLFQIQKARRTLGRTPTASAPQNVQPAQALLPADGPANDGPAAKQAIYEPQNDPTHNVPASAQSAVRRLMLRRARPSLRPNGSKTGRASESLCSCKAKKPCAATTARRRRRCSARRLIIARTSMSKCNNGCKIDCNSSRRRCQVRRPRSSKAG